MYVKGDFPTWNYNDVAGREKHDVTTHIASNYNLTVQMVKLMFLLADKFNISTVKSK